MRPTGLKVEVWFEVDTYRGRLRCFIGQLVTTGRSEKNAKTNLRYGPQSA